MNRLAVLLVAATLGAAACSKTREPDDAQLRMFLRPAGVPADQEVARLDSFTVLCLRALSGDDTLKRGLPARIGAEDGMKRCKERVEGKLGDAATNPGAFTLSELTEPKTVRRAMALLEASATARPPRREGAAPPVARARPPAKPQPAIPDADTVLREAEETCRLSRERSAEPGAAPGLQRIVTMCDRLLEDSRKQITQLRADGDEHGVEMIARNVWRMTQSGRQLLEKSAPK